MVCRERGKAWLDRGFPLSLCMMMGCLNIATTLKIHQDLSIQFCSAFPLDLVTMSRKTLLVLLSALS